MEILLKSDSAVHITSRKIIQPPDIDFDESQGRNDAVIKSAKKKYEFARVSIQAKTIRVADVETVRTGKMKQDVTIADETDTITVTLWEENVGRLELGKSYYLGNFVIRDWAGERYLAMYAESSIELVDDIACVSSNAVPSDDNIVIDAEVVAVVQLRTQKTCIRCGSRVEENVHNLTLARCSSADCLMLQTIDICNTQTSAKLTIMSGASLTTLTTGDQFLKDMIGEGEITENALLSLPPVGKILYNNRNVVTGVVMEPDQENPFSPSMDLEDA